MDDDRTFPRASFQAHLGAALSRRSVLITSLGAASGSLLLGLGCRWQAKVADAYAPWDFDPSSEPPEVASAMGAILAANPHNTQPWLFRIRPEAVEVFADLGQSLGPMDSLHREMHIGLGCAIENLVLAAAAVGRRADVTLLPDEADETLVAHVALSAQAPAPTALSDAIPLRHTNRGPYDEAPLPAAFRRGLLDRAGEACVSARWIEDEAARAEILERSIEATRAIVEDREMNEASHAWWRQTADEITEHRTGTTLDAIGASGCARSLGRTASPDADKAGRYWLAATEGRQGTAAAWVLLSTPDLEDRAQQLTVGRVFQRMHLHAEAEGYALQPSNQALERRDRELTAGRPAVFGPWLEQLAGGQHAQMLFRLGVPRRPALPSPRQPLSWVEIE